jgi:hypothetical protein
MQFSPASCNFFPLSPNYLSRRPIFENSQPVVPFMPEAKFHTHLKKNRQKCLSVYFNFLKFLGSK